MHVVVVGAGISGLSCARLLLRDGHDVTLVSGDPLQRTTSHLAAAVWFPTAAGPPDAVARWGAATYDVLAAEAAAGVPGVVMRESMQLLREPAPTGPGPAPLPPWAAAVGDVRPARPDELPSGYPRGLRYAVPLVEMPTYLPHLHAEVRGAGARQVLRRVSGLDGVLDLRPDVVVNAAGLAAGALVGDASTYPVRGQIVRVVNPGLDEVLDLRPDVVVNAAGLAAGALVGDASTYPVRGQIVRVVNPGLDLSVRDEEHPGGRAYVHPRTADCILGGTLDVGSWDTTPDPAETAAIVARCTDIAPALAGARVLESVAGLRPGRPQVRVEVDRSLLPVPVVHDYGHGGSGITIGWGCAQEVAALVAGLAGRADDGPAG
jgi:D-amino-acid oxidase